MRTGSARAVGGVLILAAWVGQHTDAGAPATGDASIDLAWSARPADLGDGESAPVSQEADGTETVDSAPVDAADPEFSDSPDGDGAFACVYRVTAYCDRGITAAGVQVGVGQCAAPASIPFGSTIYIPALDRTFVVTDRTHKRFRHNTVDLFIPSRGDCLQFGRRSLECIVTPPIVRHRYGSREFLRLAAAARSKNASRAATPNDPVSPVADAGVAEPVVNRIVRSRWALAMASPLIGARGTW